MERVYVGDRGVAFTDYPGTVVLIVWSRANTLFLQIDSQKLADPSGWPGKGDSAYKKLDAAEKRNVPTEERAWLRSAPRDSLGGVKSTLQTLSFSTAQVFAGGIALSEAIQRSPQGFCGTVYKKCAFAREHTR